MCVVGMQVVNKSMLLVAWSAVPGAHNYAVIVNDGITKFVDWPSKSLPATSTDARPSSDDCSMVLVEGLRSDVPYKASVAAKHGEI